MFTVEPLARLHINNGAAPVVAVAVQTVFKHIIRYRHITGSARFIPLFAVAFKHNRRPGRVKIIVLNLNLTFCGNQHSSRPVVQYPIVFKYQITAFCQILGYVIYTNILRAFVEIKLCATCIYNLGFFDRIFSVRNKRFWVKRLKNA